MAETIGTGNKLVFLGIGPSVRIVNAWVGDWAYGCWFSNGGYKSFADRWGSYRYSGRDTAIGWNHSRASNRSGSWERDPNSGEWEYSPLVTSHRDESAWDRGTWQRNERGYYVFVPNSEKPVAPESCSAQGDPKGIKRVLGTACCGHCGSTDLELVAGICRDCYWCLDCDSALSECDCYMSSYPYSARESLG